MLNSPTPQPTTHGIHPLKGACILSKHLPMYMNISVKFSNLGSILVYTWPMGFSSHISIPVLQRRNKRVASKGKIYSLQISNVTTLDCFKVTFK